MTYDLFVRFDDTHTTYAELAVVDATLTEHGLHKTSGNQWILDVDGRWIELYLSTVTQGPDGGGSVAGDGSRFNELQLHTPHRAPGRYAFFELALALGDRLGWKVYDPQIGELVDYDFLYSMDDDDD